MKGMGGRVGERFLERVRRKEGIIRGVDIE